MVYNSSCPQGMRNKRAADSETCKHTLHHLACEVSIASFWVQWEQLLLVSLVWLGKLSAHPSCRDHSRRMWRKTEGERRGCRGVSEKPPFFTGRRSVRQLTRSLGTQPDQTNLHYSVCRDLTLLAAVPAKPLTPSNIKTVFNLKGKDLQLRWSLVSTTVGKHGVPLSLARRENESSQPKFSRKSFPFIVSSCPGELSLLRDRSSLSAGRRTWLSLCEKHFPADSFWVEEKKLIFYQGSHLSEDCSLYSAPLWAQQ